MNGTILANRTAIDRNKTDFYRTPPEVTVALLNFLEEHGDIRPKGQPTIWEPACGTGEMVEAMKAKGYRVIYSDLYPTGYGWNNIPHDFLSDAPRGLSYEWIITNPPFSQAEKFIRRALELGKPCAFLLKSQFWHARSRLALFREHPPSYVLPLTWRPDFLWGAKAGSPTMEENLFRVYTLREMGFDPYVMIYNKPEASQEIRRLQRWCNNKFIFKSCPRFEDYDPRRR